MKEYYWEIDQDLEFSKETKLCFPHYYLYIVRRIELYLTNSEFQGFRLLFYCLFV